MGSASSINRLWGVSIWIAAAVGVGALVVNQSLILVVVLAVGMLLAAPSGLFLIAAVGLEEQTSAGGSSLEASSLIRFGGDTFYYQEFAGLRVATLVALAVATILVVRHGPGATWGRCKRETFVASAIALWAFGLAVSQGTPVLMAVTSVTPWLVIVCAIAAGAHLSRRTATVVVVTLGVKALIGSVSYVRGETLWHADQFFELVFYDSALTSVAAAVLLALFVSRSTLSGWRPWVSAMLCGLVVLFAARRNVLVSAGLVTVFLLFFAAHRRLWSRVLVVGLLVVLAGVVFPSKTSGIVSSFESAWATIAGENDERSTSEHIEDLRVAWEIGAEHPIAGIGALSGSLDGLATSETSSRLYVHSEFLQTWLRWGLPGVVGLMVLIGWSLRRAFLAVRSQCVVVTAAACWLLMLPATLVFFPHISTTWRWPMLFGVAVALTANASSRTESRAGRPTEATHAACGKR